MKPYTEKQIADAAKQSQLKVQNYVNKSMDTIEKSVEKEKLQYSNFRRRKNNKTIPTVWRGNK
ncbi:hypothetical protein AAHB57_17180 [Bacillus cereus]